MKPCVKHQPSVALLALGRTGNQQRLYTQQQQQALSNPTTDALLGGALNATVSSRVQKLFGAGSVKLDPNYLGALGNSTSRIIVEEQLGTNVTLTYATDVDTTGQQLIQADVAVNQLQTYLASWRNLGEQAVRIGVARVQEISVQARIEITGGIDFEQLLAEIFFDVDQMLSRCALRGAVDSWERAAGPRRHLRRPGEQSHRYRNILRLGGQ